MKNLLKLLLVLTAFWIPTGLYAQLATTSTTLATAITAAYTGQWCIASATGVVLPSLSASAAGSYLVVDKEAAQVRSQGTSAPCFNVRRGVLGTQTAAHGTISAVWVGNAATGTGDNSRPFSGGPFVTFAPSGTCTATLQYTLPVIVVNGPGLPESGRVFNCVAGNWFAGDPQLGAGMPYTAFTTISPPNPIAVNSTTDVNGTIWFSQLLVPANATLTGACLLNGATVGTDKWIFALYDSSGALIANTATAGTTTATASKYQCIAFTATVAVYGNATYFIAMQGNGTTDTFATYAANAVPTNYGTNNQTGTFGTLAAITPTVTFTANKGPIMMAY